MGEAHLKQKNLVKTSQKKETVAAKKFEGQAKDVHKGKDQRYGSG